MADYISRDDVFRKFIEGDGHDDDRFTEGYNFAVQEYREKVKKIPAADVQPINRWISVNDRLPENCIEVLVYDTDCGIVIGWYDKEIGDFAADFISPLDAVTHWQPLPEPPKDGEQND